MIMQDAIHKVVVVQRFPAEVEFASFHLIQRYKISSCSRKPRYFLSQHSCYVCILCMLFLLWCCLCALSALNISSAIPNSMTPPHHQSSFLFSACYVSSIDVTSPDTSLGFLFRRYRPSK